MANPQLENGYLRLSNELAEALARARLNGAQFRIVLTIARECYGRNGGRKVAALSLMKMANRTGLDCRNVQREVNRLLRAGLLTRQPNGGRNLYGIQKDYERWQLPSPRKLGGSAGGDGQFADGQLTNGQVTKEGTVNSPSKGTVNSPTHNKKKEKSLKNAQSFDEFWKLYPKKVAKKAAFNAFKKINPRDALLKQILAALERQAASEKWQRDRGKFIPDPPTWLNGERWEDELVTPMAANKQLTQADHYRNLGKGKREQACTAP